MPAPVVGWLVAGLVSAAGSMAGQALAGLGIAFVVNEFALPPIIDTLRAQLNGAPAVLVQAISYCGADKAITIILSAYAVRNGAGMVKGIKRRPVATP